MNNENSVEKEDVNLTDTEDSDLETSFSGTWKRGFVSYSRKIAGMAALIGTIGVLWTVVIQWEAKASTEQVEELLKEHNKIGHGNLRKEVGELSARMSRLEKLQRLHYFNGLYRSDVTDWYSKSKRNRGSKPRKSNYHELTKLEAEMGFANLHP